MTPGTAPDCPTDKNDGAYYLWSTDRARNQLDGYTDGYKDTSNRAPGPYAASSMGALPHDLVIPYAVRLDIHTGGGVAFGWEKEAFLVR